MISNDSSRYKQNNKQFCGICNKILPLFIIKCKCNKLFCKNHRYPDEHNCSYNYKEEYKKELKEKNIVIKSNKIDKI